MYRQVIGMSPSMPSQVETTASTPALGPAESRTGRVIANSEMNSVPGITKALATRLALAKRLETV